MIVRQTQILAAPSEMERVRCEAPDVYKAGDVWKFSYSWHGEDSGFFASEQEAKDAALDCKQQKMARFFAAGLRQS